MKIKKMQINEFEEVLKRDWIPVQLLGDAKPEWTQNIPEKILHSVYASGCTDIFTEVNYQNEKISSMELIGGIDIYRNAPDDPVELNKDWYAVIKCTEDSTLLLVDGPVKDREHWLNEIPDRFNGVEILGIPKKSD